MIGLEKHERDRRLPEQLGDPQLVVPEDEEVLEWVRRGMCLPSGPEPESVELEYTRWKPRVALTAVWRVHHGTGHEDLVTMKRHLGDKADTADQALTPSKHFERSGARLLPSLSLDDGRTSLRTFPNDRRLRGVERVMDSRRTARLLESTGQLEALAIRRGASSTTLLRYKPERRAVVRFDAVLRGMEEQDPQPFLLRVLPVSEAARACAMRQALQDGTTDVPVPSLVGSDEENGILVEEWCLGVAPEPGCFDHAEEAGTLLAALHGSPLAPEHLPEAPASRPSRAMLELDAELAELSAGLPSVSPQPPTSWIHGDFHPDQMLFAPERVTLIDLDGLRPGEPCEDLASWIADHLAREPGAHLPDAYAALRGGYCDAGREAPDPERLRVWVVDGLLDRASAALRRLEVDALARARRLVRLARQISTEGGLLA